MPPPDSSKEPNPFLLAADASAALLPLLRNDRSLITAQDSSGYSILHALVSYSHLSLLRQIVAEFHPPLDMRDSDGDTPLFAAETVEAAQCLVEELGLDWRIRNAEGETAEEKIRGEGDFVTVADYLGEVRRKAGPDDGTAEDTATHPPPLPKGMTLNVGTISEDEMGDVADEGFRRRIEELARREDFEGEEGQEQLRALVQDAVRDIGADSKEARPRTE
jgi:uncharacterized protein